MLPILLATAALTAIGPMGADPAREPQLAASGSLVAMTFGAGSSIYFSATHDSGRTFLPPVKVAEAGVLPLNRHRGPRIAISGHTVLIAAVIGKTLSTGQHAHGLASDGDLTLWRSTDAGKTWSSGLVINDVPAAPREGLHSLAADAEGHVLAVWLDQREALDKREATGTRIYGARSSDAGRTWSKNFLIYASPGGAVCECCHPSAALGAAGSREEAVMWRNSLDGSRDLYLASSRNGAFSTPEKLGTGTWKLNACPMDGGGLAITRNGIVTAWRRNDTIFLDQPGKPERPLGPGKDVALAASARKTYAVWSSATGVILWNDGVIKTLDTAGALPSVTALPSGGAVAAWEKNGSIETAVIGH